jgi:drug/metabolite transporter (DMT)-like permease
MAADTKALSGAAFATLLLIALMMGANHVSARFAFNNGVDVLTAVSARSGVTAIVLAIILWRARVPWALSERHRIFLPAIGLVITAQSICIYSSVARLPVALALLAFNTYPLSTALWARALYGHRPERALLVAIPFLLLGLSLALDVSGAISGLGAVAHWQEIGVGVAFAFAASAFFGLALVLTQHEASALDGRVRTFTTMLVVGTLASLGAELNGGMHWPNADAGWIGLALLTFLYGTAFTIMFTVLPRLGVVGNSAIMNVEPVFALMMAWAFLDQKISWIQVIGALIVVATVMGLGLRKSRT